MGGPPKNSTNVYTAHNNPESIVTTEVEVRAPKMNALLNGEDIDVAGFQEVSANTRWVRWLRANLDEKYGMVAAHTFDIRSGVYIIYRKERLEVLDNGIFWLAEGAPATPAKLADGNFQRICNWALFRVKATGEVFVFMDTHLAAGLCKTAASDATPSKVRAAQTRILVSQIPVIRESVKEKFGIEDCPFILVGDMNTIWERRSTIIWRACWTTRSSCQRGILKMYLTLPSQVASTERPRTRSQRDIA